MRMGKRPELTYEGVFMKKFLFLILSLFVFQTSLNAFLKPLIVKRQTCPSAPRKRKKRQITIRYISKKETSKTTETQRTTQPSPTTLQLLEKSHSHSINLEKKYIIRGAQ